MLSQADPQPDRLIYPNGCLKQGRNMDGEVILETSIALYGGAPSSESPSWSPLGMTMEPSCPSASPKSSSTERSRDFVSTSPTPQVGSNDELDWHFQPPKHSDFVFIGGFDGTTGDSSGYTYDLALGDCQHDPVYLLPSPHGIYNVEPQDYSLCVPSELSSICLDNPPVHTHSRPLTLPLRNIHLGPSTPFHNNRSQTSSSSPGSVSPTSNGSFPFTTHMSASTSAPMSSRHSSRNSDGNDGDFVPELQPKRKFRAVTSAKRSTSTQYNTSYSESLVQRYPCTFPSCSLAFARARDLRRHFRLHSGELPYKCLVCGRGFIRSDARARHWRSQPDCETRF